MSSKSWRYVSLPTQWSKFHSYDMNQIKKKKLDVNCGNKYWNKLPILVNGASPGS